MKKLLGFIVGLLTMLVVFAMVYMSGAIYDMGGKAYIEPFFMRIGVNAADITESPRPLKDFQQSRLRDWMIQKFVYEYLYIEPTAQNIERRTSAQGFYAPLYMMANEDVFKTWCDTEAKDMGELAAKGVHRTVRVFDEILTDGDYYVVDYETKTWYKPNDMTVGPITERGTMYLGIEYTGQLRQPQERAVELLRDGIDPATMFGFSVTKVIKIEK